MADQMTIRLQAFATAVGDLIKTRVSAVRTLILGGAANLSTLPTTDKTSILAALIEIHGQLGSGGLTEAQVNSLIGDAIADLVGTAPETLDTIQELATAAGAADSAVQGLLTAVGNRVRFDAVQTLTAPQRAQARANIGAVEDVDTDYVALLTTAAA